MRSSLLLILPNLLVAVVSFLPAAAPPPPRGDITDSVKGAEGLEEALRNLRAVMVTTPPLSPTEALKRFKTLPGMRDGPDRRRARGEAASVCLL